MAFRFIKHILEAKDYLKQLENFKTVLPVKVVHSVEPQLGKVSNEILHPWYQNVSRKN